VEIEPVEDVACTAACTCSTEPTSQSGSEQHSGFTAAMLMIARLPLTDAEKAEAVRRLLER
jgi:hypothetical protein